MTNDKNQITSYWQSFCELHDISTSTPYSAWSYGETAQMADELADLTVRGIKTATTSAADLYEENEPKPYIGEYNIILDGKNKPVCVTQTKVVEVVPYNLVSAEHAYHEGEGDRTLRYWRKVHDEFFRTVYAEEKRIFNESIPCICEVFEVID